MPDDDFNDSQTTSTPITEELIGFENIKDPKDLEILDKIKGSVIKYHNASGIIWSKKNKYKIAVMVTSGKAAYIEKTEPKTEIFFDFTSKSAQQFSSKLVPPSGDSIQHDFLNPALTFYKPHLTSYNKNIHPKEDFFFFVIDNQKKIDQLPLPQFEPSDLKTETQIYDPAKRTTATKTWNTPKADEELYLIGYPNSEEYPNGAISKGKVLSDEEATTLCQKLQQSNENEQYTNYDPKIEIIVLAQTLKGMIGGGAFNENAEFIGTIIQTHKIDDQHFTRVIRADFMRDSILNFYKKSPLQTRELFKDYLPHTFE